MRRERHGPVLTLTLALRADFLGLALMHRPFADALQDADVKLGPMTRTELRGAIENPAVRLGVVFEPGLVERILDDVGDEPGNLPLLEFALTQLWDRQVGGRLTHAAYEAIGKVEGALARYAEEVYTGLSQPEQEQAQRVLVQMVHPGEGTEDTRRLAIRAELSESDWELARKLADARLVVTDRDAAGQETVEVVHEALVRAWERLRSWINKDRELLLWRQRLRTALTEWQRTGHDEGALLRGIPLIEAEHWLSERPNDLISAEQEYIHSSLQNERERKALVTTAAALRGAASTADILPVIDLLFDLLKADGAALVRRIPTTGETVIELARGTWAKWIGEHLSLHDRVSGQVVAADQPYVNNEIQTNRPFSRPDLFGDIRALVCVPLITQEQTIGELWIGRRTDINDDDVRLLTAIGNMVAGAVHRVTLYEEAERRLHRIAALQAVDLAISESLDLRVSLNVFFDQITAQLGVDAAAVLLLDPQTHTLKYAAGRGFRTPAIASSHLRLGEDYAGRAALKRHIVHVPNLAETGSDFVHTSLLKNERFVAYYGVPLIAKGQVKGVLEIFHRAPLSPDSEWLEFLQTMAGQAAIAIDNATLFNDLQRSNVELTLAYDAVLEGWSRALELRDKETEGHTLRVTELTLHLARAAGAFTEDELGHVRRGALLHDIGYMGIPDSILLKPGPLTDEEWEILRKHPDYAYEMLAPIAFLRPALDIPYCHHEKWDGTGYPRRLKGEQIPLAARIFAIVDMWDALRSDRPYRMAWPEERVREHIKSLAGTYFDPKVVEVFLSVTSGG